MSHFDKLARLAPVVISIVCLTGCINIVPFPSQVNEKKDAMALASTFKRLRPDAAVLLKQEHDCANELKITMDEAGDQVGGANGREKFSSFIDRLIAIRNKRQQIREVVGQTVYETSMVHRVQHNAMVTLGDQVSVTQTLIQFAENLRLRAELGRTKEYPELTALNKQLDFFLSQTQEEPFATQMTDLIGEYRFGEGELAP